MIVFECLWVLFPNKSAIQYMLALMCYGSVNLKKKPYPSLNITANTWTSSLSKGCSHITKYQSNWMMFSLPPAHIVSMDHARFIHFHITISLDFFPLIIMSGVLNFILCGAISCYLDPASVSCLKIATCHWDWIAVAHYAVSVIK